MGAGDFDRKLSLAIYTPVRLSTGDKLDLYTAWKTVPCKTEEGLFNRDNEKFEGPQLTATQTTVFTIRYRLGVSKQMRLTYEGQIYDIQAISEVGRREALKITAIQKDSDSNGSGTPDGSIPSGNNPGIVPIQYDDYTVLLGNQVIPFDCTIKDCVCTLPSAAGHTRRYEVVRVDNTQAHTLTIVAASPSEVNYGNPLTIPFQGAFTLQSNGSQYLLING